MEQKEANKKVITSGVEVNMLEDNPNSAKVLTQDSVAFLRMLHEKFNPHRLKLLGKRHDREKNRAAMYYPTDENSVALRNSQWKISSIPKDLQRRHVEITGPVNAKMVVNALKSNANCYMADFEDANSPTWGNIVDGHQNLSQAICGTLAFTDHRGKFYSYTEKDASSPNRTTLIVRPRGWHLMEKNLQLNGERFSGSLTDFGLYVFHNYKELAKRGTGCYFYLPKIQHHEEASLWDKVFSFTEDHLFMPAGSIKATILIETLPAAFHLQEILHAMRTHIVGLNCGRWDYIFSAIKCLHHLPNHIYPNRGQIDMTSPFMQKYSRLVVKACHKRGAYAIGGMSANIPIKNDEAANAAMLAKIKTNKAREIDNGHDGTWVAHPGLVSIVQEVYREKLNRDNQLEVTHPDFAPTAEELTECPSGEITLAGIKENVNAALVYMESWLSGQGCLKVNHLMEDAATAEISRTQLWQWVHANAKLKEGIHCTWDLIEKEIAATLQEIETQLGQKEFMTSNFNKAAKILEKIVRRETLEPFMTDEMYELLP